MSNALCDCAAPPQGRDVRDFAQSAARVTRALHAEEAFARHRQLMSKLTFTQVGRKCVIWEGHGASGAVLLEAFAWWFDGDLADARCVLRAAQVIGRQTAVGHLLAPGYMPVPGKVRRR
jgi:hypothetical protein